MARVAFARRPCGRAAGTSPSATTTPNRTLTLDSLVATILVAFGVLIGASFALRFLGRRRLDIARCAACSLDVTEQAWSGDAASAPTCTCGATLDRPGAITTERLPARRWIRRTGTVALAAALLMLGTDALLRATDRSWLRLAPASLLAFVPRLGNDAATSQALVEIDRRARENELSPTQAIALLELDLERSFPMTNDTYGLTIELTRIADGDREALRAFAERGMALKAAPGAPSWTPTPAPIGTYQVDLSLTTRRWIGMAMVRIERVLLDGEPCSWSLVPRGTIGSSDMVGPRVFTGGARLRCTPSSPLPSQGAELTIECSVGLVRRFRTIVDVDDAILNDPAIPVSGWRVNAIPFSVRTTLRLTPASTPTPAAEEPR